MKSTFLLLALISTISSFAQKATFDLITYMPPKTWKKQTTGNAVQFTKEDAKGSYCSITMFKSVPGTPDAKENFDVAWETLVKGMVTVSTAPEMQPAATENGWEAVSGYAPFETDGNKGMVILVTSSGFEKMVNVIILTNTNVYEKNVTDFLGSVSLGKPKPGKQQPVVKEAVVVPVAKTASSGYTFTTTNFDDGWTSTAQEDWVQVLKGSTKVLIHYPNKQVDEYMSVALDDLKRAWNILVTPKYSDISNPEFKVMTGWQYIYFAEAEAREKTTGKNVHVVLFKYCYSNGTGKYLEFITPDKASFENEFCAYHQSSSGWEKMEKMATYNKFAVAAADLKGKWTNNFTGTTQYVNAYTGNSAGMDTHASNEKFEFDSGNTYKWDLGVASGFVGNIKFQSAKSNGKFSVIKNWQISFSDIEGKPKTYPASFTCIKGMRILWIDDKAFAKIE